jgi:Tfp pilus assembly protein PilN
MRTLSFLKNILVPEEPIAGLEISNSKLRLVLLGLNKQKGTIGTREYAEYPLADGIIVNGTVKDPGNLVLAFRELKRKLKIPVDYVIASIPPDNIYTKILSFPKNIEEKKLDEAVRLAVNFQLPLKPADSYCSWEILAGEVSQEVFVAEAPKKIIDPYLACLYKVFHPIALEFPAESFARIAAGEKGQSILLKIADQGSNNFFVVKDNSVRFCRTLGADYPEKKLKKEPAKIGCFYELVAGEKISQVIDLNEGTAAIDKKINFPEMENGAWLIALGAAVRGTIPRAQDNFVSLSPISAQKSYKYRKAVTFASIVSKLAIGLAVFFIAAFAGVWLLMVSLQQQAAGKIDNLSNLPSLPDLTAVEQKIQAANTLIDGTAQIISNSPQWSLVIAELQKNIISGVTIVGLGLPSADGTLTINGVAENRNMLNQFRDKLRSSPMFKNINLPLTNLEQRQDIPFAISFQLKNPSAIYFK